MSILDPEQNQNMDRMTDDMIRERIREYCTFDRPKYNRDELWRIAHPGCKIIKIDKDDRGWYVETTSYNTIYVVESPTAKSFYDYLLSHGCKIDKQKGFLIEDIGIYFRWRKHEGRITVLDIPDFSSTEGLPEELEHLHLRSCCRKNGRFIVHNKIKLMELSAIKDTKISGSGCKNIVIDPAGPCNGIVAPNGVKIHRPLEWQEYRDLIEYIKIH